MYRYAAITDFGPQLDINDDRILIDEKLLDEGEYEGETEKEQLVVAVADGVGGLQMGYKAAEETLETLKAGCHAGMGRIDIRGVIEEANRAVIGIQKQINKPDGLRTTLAALYIDGENAYVANAGDSRIYRFRGEELALLSKDHSIVQNMLDNGEITEEEAYTHPRRNVITKCIGDEDKVNARIVDFSEDILSGDIYLLCSDGISDCMRTEEIQELFREEKEKPLVELCRSFIRRAVQNGSTDNISICLLRKV